MNNRRAGGLVFISAGVYGLILTLRLPLGRLKEPGAGAFPLIVSILLSISGILIFLTAKGSSVSDWRGILKRQWTPLQIVILTGAFILALNWAGYLLAALLYLFALFFGVSRYKLWIASVFSVAIGVGSWYIFGKLLQTPLPSGFLGL